MSDYNWVLPRLSVGGYINEYDRPQLVAENIGYIINAGAQHPFDETGFDVLSLNIADDGESKLQVFKEVVAPWFMAKWWENPSKRFNIHCDAGINRGPSTAMFCLMMLGFPASTAQDLIVGRRLYRYGAGLAYKADAIKAAEDLGFLVR